MSILARGSVRRNRIQLGRRIWSVRAFWQQWKKGEAGGWGPVVNARVMVGWHGMESASGVKGTQGAGSFFFFCFLSSFFFSFLFFYFHSFKF